MQAVRSLVFSAYLVTVTLILSLLYVPLLLTPRTVMRPFYRFWTQAVYYGFAVIMGVRTEIRGRERLPKGPLLIAAKHQSMWDTVVFDQIFFDPAFVLKRELLQLPFYGWYIRKMGHVAIDRDSHASALRQMVAEARMYLGQGRHIVIFPEGTRAPAGAKNDYKPGVAALYRQLNTGGAKVPCVPVALTSGTCWPRKGWLGFRSGTIVLEFLEPLPQDLDRRRLMAELEARIETATDRLLKEAPGGAAP